MSLERKVNELGPKQPPITVSQTEFNMEADPRSDYFPHKEAAGNDGTRLTADGWLGTIVFRVLGSLRQDSLTQVVRTMAAVKTGDLGN